MEWLITGKVRGSFGLEGFLKIESTSGEYGHFFSLKEIKLRFPHIHAEDAAGVPYQVEACTVRKGNTVGTITDVVEGGGGSLLELSEAATGRVVYIPFRSEFIGKISVHTKQVELMHRWILE